jgi:hypothetical protein
LVPSADSGDDFVWIGGPGEGFCIVVGLGDEAVDSGLKVGDGSEVSGPSAGTGTLNISGALPV